MTRQYRMLVYTAVALVGLLALGFVLADLLQPQTAFADGDDRINCHNASPIAIYCTDAGVTVYSASGDFLLFVSREAIDAAGTPDVNTLVGGIEGELAMYVLDTGEYQINYYGAEELYVSIWTGCHVGAADIKVWDIATGAFVSDDEGCKVEELPVCGPEPQGEYNWQEDYRPWLLCVCPGEREGSIDYQCCELNELDCPS